MSLTYNDPMEKRTARLTILVDPRKKKIFEELCAMQDLTPSQVVRKLMRQWIMENAGGRELPSWLTRASGSDG
jgi:hypothetical protein